MIHAENRLAPRMVLIITNHEYRRKLEQTFQNFRIPIYYQCQGHGTAPSEMLDIFGLSGSGRLLTIGCCRNFSCATCLTRCSSASRCTNAAAASC